MSRIEKFPPVDQEVNPPVEPNNAWVCQVCGRIRACPYAPMHWAWLVKFTLCGCGDAAVATEDEITAAGAALNYAIQNNLI